MALNPRQAKFVRAYHSTGNATKSYASVYGVGDKVAGTLGPRLLEKVGIQKALTRLQEGAEIRSRLKKADLIDRLADIIDAAPNEATHDNPLCELAMTKEGPEAVFPSKLGAITALARLIGAEKPKKVELTADSEVVEMLRGLTGAREKES